MEPPKNILLVEDEAVTGKLVESVLQSQGYEVTVASNGREGLAKIKARVPDLIISDVVMPEMDGFAFYKELKKSPTTADVPVIILTARGKMQDTFATLGVDEFFVKPFENEAFLTKVQILIARGKASGVPVEVKDFSVLTKTKEPLPIGQIVLGAVILLILFITFVLFRQFTSARQAAVGISDEMKAEEDLK